MFEYTGNLHIHSRHSDGEGTIAEIAGVAARVGLDFIIITDHGGQGFLKNEEGYRHGILVLVGMEANVEANHYLALDISYPVPDNTENPQQVIDEVNRQNGIGIIAHPFEKGSPYVDGGKTYQWLDWSVHSFQGIEIWNFLSQFRDALKSLSKGLYLLFINPLAGITAPCPEALAFVDHIQEKGIKVIAVGSSDAHGIEKKVGFFTASISPYELCFKTINMHVLCEEKLNGQLEHDKKQVYEALRSGRCWVAIDYYRQSKGFRYIIKSGDKVYQMGGKIRFQPGLTACIKTPGQARTTLFRNGKKWGVSTGSRHTFSNLIPGVYRVEVYQRLLFKYKPWIFSNSIWIE